MPFSDGLSAYKDKPGALLYIMVNAIKELKEDNEKKDVKIEALKAAITEIRSVVGMTTGY